MPSPGDVNSGHQVQLLRGSTAYFSALVAAMDASQHEIRLETYIFTLQGAAEQVAQALLRAAQRGVAVYLVVDGVGTPELPAQWVEKFDAAGVHWHVFSPLGRWGLLLPSRWRRLHRKLCVVDAQVAFCGGINILDDWLDPHHGALAAPRFDFALRIIGRLVGEVQTTMEQFWWRLQTLQRVRQVDWAGTRQAWRQLNLPLWPRGVAQAGAIEGVRAALVLRDNLLHRSRIERAYRVALANAHHDIVLANAYFLPGRKIRRALRLAAQRGVRVRLLLQGRYEYFMQYHATHALYGPLLSAGIEIYEYQASFLHAKVAVVDDHWATVGSSNMDPLSLLLAREANVVLDDGDFALTLRQELEWAMQHDSTRLDRQAHTQRPWRLKLLDHGALLLMRLLLFVNGKRY